MKELSIEEKARRYDEALERAKEINRKDIKLDPSITTYEYIFPELKESGDERMRKDIIHILKGELNYTSKEDISKYIAWLEKQGEQKVPVNDFKAKDWYVSKVDGKIHNLYYNPTDKVEPKFHNGQWITNGDYTWKIVEVKPLDYILQSQDGNIVDDTISHVDEHFHLWTIQDAKDGDVLACGDKITDCPFIFHNLTDELNPRSYCGINRLQHFQDNDENGGFWCCSDEVRPATKEQRDTLMKAMTDAGWEFDFDKKELKNIEQNSAWSEEDEYILLHTINDLKFLKDTISIDPNYAVNIIDIEREIDWLKSLKQRIGG